MERPPGLTGACYWRISGAVLCATEHTAGDSCRTVRGMNIKKISASLALAAVSLASITAQAWKVQEDHNSTMLILCADSSNATVTFSEGYWTVAAAGEHGATGGRFTAISQAALKACGES
jgi:hypothetical protein